ncbi:MAG: hypothetical protein ACYTBX_09310 [Planctomycetota bacterium]
MAKKKEGAKKSKKLRDKVHRYTVKALIDEDQREYIEGVREWLNNPLRNKGKVVGGPV